MALKQIDKKAIAKKIEDTISELTDNGESFRFDVRGIKKVIKALYPDDTDRQIQTKFSIFLSERPKYMDNFSEADLKLLRHMMGINPN